MWGWLRAIFGGIFDALFGWWQRQRDKPNTLKDAKTPDKVRDDLGDSVSDWMRDQDRNHRD